MVKWKYEFDNNYDSFIEKIKKFFVFKGVGTDDNKMLICRQWRLSKTEQCLFEWLDYIKLNNINVKIKKEVEEGNRAFY